MSGAMRHSSRQLAPAAAVTTPRYGQLVRDEEDRDAEAQEAAVWGLVVRWPEALLLLHREMM